MNYFVTAIIIGVLSGLAHNLILFKHVFPYMQQKGWETERPFRINKILADYYRIDDPEERRMKFILRCLKVPFFIAVLFVAYGIHAISKISL